SGIWRRHQRAGLHAHPASLCRARARRAATDARGEHEGSCAMKHSVDGTRERFVAAIGSTVNAEAIEEAHFFVPIKHSGMESGVAVIALREEPLLVDAEGRAENTRHAVYTARYRLTLKGPDRGKWDFSIIA